jgi:benzoyl-CoA reductase subunit D
VGAILAAGVDVGTSAVKAALVQDAPGRRAELLATELEKIRRRDPAAVVDSVWERLLARAGVSAADVAYCASTGDGEAVRFRRGHFYGMTCHARGALFLEPSTCAVLDGGALHARAIVIDERARVRSHKMTNQCASGSGQFLENIARYLGVSIPEVGALSLQAERAEPVSGICAVLAETDVINMVSRGVPAAEILRGIHESIAGRMAKLVRSVGAAGTLTLTGGLAADVGLRAALARKLLEDGAPIAVAAPPLAPIAGAIGAALWAAFRHAHLAEQPAVSAPASEVVSSR